MALPAAADAPAKAAVPILEGVDFIETEEDAKAVEAATLKIQSTFRGKKIRSKLGGSTTTTATATTKPNSDNKEAASADTTPEGDLARRSKQAGQEAQRGVTGSVATPPTSTTTTTTTAAAAATKELSTKVAEMQVNDNSNKQQLAAASEAAGEAPAANSNATCGLPEEEAERAATKIQAGFKGYKTRKELEGKLASGGGAGALGSGLDDK